MKKEEMKEKIRKVINKYNFMTVDSFSLEEDLIKELELTEIKS